MDGPSADHIRARSNSFDLHTTIRTVVRVVDRARRKKEQGKYRIAGDVKLGTVVGRGIPALMVCAHILHYRDTTRALPTSRCSGVSMYAGRDKGLQKTVSNFQSVAHPARE